MMNNKFSLIMAIFWCFILLGCASKNDGAFRWIDGSEMIAKKDEIKKKQQILLNLKHSEDIEEKIDEGIVFDGTVVEINVNAETGLHIAKLFIDRILFGRLENQEFIVIHTPSIEKGGVAFQANKKYRVFTVYINNAHRTWASSGTVELPEKNKGRAIPP